MARPTLVSANAGSASGTSVAFASGTYSGATTDDALVVVIDVQQFAETITPPAGWTTVSSGSISSGDGDLVSHGVFVLPAGTTKSGTYTFTFGSAVYTGGGIAVVRGSSLEFANGNGELHQGTDGNDVLVSGLGSGVADRLGIAGVGSFNNTLTANEGSWNNEVDFNGSYGALYSYDAGTAAVANFDTGLNDSDGWGSASVVFWEGSSGSDVSATVAATLGAVTMSVTGVAERLATVSVPLGAVAFSSTGVRGRAASVSAALGAVVFDVDAEVNRPATVAAPLGGAALTISAERESVASISAPLGGVSLAVVAQPETAAVVAAPLGGVSLAVVGVRGRSASVAASLGGATLTASAEREVVVTVSASLGGVTLSVAGDVGGSGTAVVAAALGAAVLSVDGTRGRGASVAASLGGAALTVSAERESVASISAPLGGVSMAVAGTVIAGAAAVVAAPLGGATLAVTAVRVREGQITLSPGGISLVVSGEREVVLTGSCPLGGVSLSVAGTRNRQAAISAPLGAASFSMTEAATVVVSNLTVLSIVAQWYVERLARQSRIDRIDTAWHAERMTKL